MKAPDDELRRLLRDYYASEASPAPHLERLLRPREDAETSRSHHFAPALAFAVALVLITGAAIFWPDSPGPTSRTVAYPAPATPAAVITEALPEWNLPTDAWLADAEDAAAFQEVTALSSEITELFRR